VLGIFGKGTVFRPANFRRNAAYLRTNCYICRMYIPESFAVTDFQTIRSFLTGHPFGVLTMNGKEGIPTATHLPFLPLFDGETIVLEGHIANLNEQQAFIRDGQSAKMIVSGAHGYVSSSVYGHVNVPTYNYEAIHLTGTLSVMTEQQLLEHLRQVVARFENGRSLPIDFDQWPLKMIAHFIEEITGFRLTVTKTEAAFKLSQNRNETDFQNIINDLQNGNPDQIRLAERMSHFPPLKRDQGG
jgi:transcriptional regulator